LKTELIAKIIIPFAVSLVTVMAQNETVSTAENQPTEDPATSRFTWTIENFSRINTKKHYSDSFAVGNYRW
jgi:ubiquitin carboxyl-terminal hydrolase 7